MKIRFRGARVGRGAAAADGSTEPRSFGARGAGGAGAGGGAVPGAPGAAGPALPLLGTDGRRRADRQTDAGLRVSLRRRRPRPGTAVSGHGTPSSARRQDGRTAPGAVPGDGHPPPLRGRARCYRGAPAPPPLPAKLLQVGAVALSASPHGFAFLSLSPSQVSSAAAQDPPALPGGNLRFSHPLSQRSAGAEPAPRRAAVMRDGTERAARLTRGRRPWRYRYGCKLPGCGAERGRGRGRAGPGRAEPRCIPPRRLLRREPCSHRSPTWLL